MPHVNRFAHAHASTRSAERVPGRDGAGWERLRACVFVLWERGRGRARCVSKDGFNCTDQIPDDPARRGFRTHVIFIVEPSYRPIFPPTLNDGSKLRHQVQPVHQLLVAVRNGNRGKPFQFLVETTSDKQRSTTSPTTATLT